MRQEQELVREKIPRGRPWQSLSFEDPHPRGTEDRPGSCCRASGVVSGYRSLSALLSSAEVKRPFLRGKTCRYTAKHEECRQWGPLRVLRQGNVRKHHKHCAKELHTRSTEAGGDECERLRYLNQIPRWSCFGCTLMALLQSINWRVLRFLSNITFPGLMSLRRVSEAQEIRARLRTRAPPCSDGIVQA